MSIERRYYKCDGCGGYFEVDDITYITGRWTCRACDPARGYPGWAYRSTAATKSVKYACACCDDVTDKRQLTYINDHAVCPRCADESVKPPVLDPLDVSALRIVWSLYAWAGIGYLTFSLIKWVLG